MKNAVAGFIVELSLVFVTGVLLVFLSAGEPVASGADARVDSLLWRVDQSMNIFAYGIASVACGTGFLFWLVTTPPSNRASGRLLPFLAMLFLPVALFLVIAHFLPLRDLLMVLSEHYGRLAAPALFAACAITSKLIHFFVLTLPERIRWSQQTPESER